MSECQQRKNMSIFSADGMQILPNVPLRSLQQDEAPESRLHSVVPLTWRPAPVYLSLSWLGTLGLWFLWRAPHFCICLMFPKDPTQFMQFGQKHTKTVSCPSQLTEPGGSWGGLVPWEVHFDLWVKVGSASFLHWKAIIVPFAVHKCLMERCFELM